MKLLVYVYKSFARPRLDYGDIIYDQKFNESSNQRIEFIQYNAVIVISSATRGTSYEKLYQEIGLESLKSKGWLRKLYSFYKIYHKSYFCSYNLVPDRLKFLFYQKQSNQ